MAQTFAQRAGLILAGGGVYLGASGLVYMYMTAGKADQDETNLQLLGSRHQEGHHQHDTSSNNNDNNLQQFSFVTNPDRKEKFDDIAAKYDFLINNDERFMLMGVLRRSLLYWHARGTVLEMAAGTGRNCAYYPASVVDRVILTDTSGPMLQQAHAKVFEMQRGSSSNSSNCTDGDDDDEISNVKPKFAILKVDGNSAANHHQLDFADNSFDTVVDTFGLCSFDDPVAALQQMARVCKPDGKILLLEHGRSKSFNWLSEYLDKTAERHAKNWGCVHNRDLDQILEDSGLQVETLHTWHFGTTYYTVCRPNKES